MGAKGATVSNSLNKSSVLEEGHGATGSAMCHVSFPFDRKDRALAPHSQGKQNSVGCLLEPRPFILLFLHIHCPSLSEKTVLEAFLGRRKGSGQGNRAQTQ